MAASRSGGAGPVSESLTEHIKMKRKKNNYQGKKTIFVTP
jgi:hypothetical protein